MNQKQYAIWTGIAGLLFLIVGFHDLFVAETIKKSVLAISFEFIGGFGFILNSFLILRKERSQDK